jgi:hypothetical protein
MRTWLIRAARTAAAIGCALGLSASPARAQASGASAPAPQTGWQFEIHGGPASAGALTKVFTSALPTAGPSFTDLRGGTSRQVPSWFLGDGALLANQVAAENGLGLTIVPLDSVLTQPSANRSNKGSFGFRIGHTITRHVLAEFTYDSISGNLNIDPTALAAIGATVASYQPYWDALIHRQPVATNVSVSATKSVADGVKSKLKVVTGDVAINIVSVRGWTPYLELGGGIVFPSGDDAAAGLVGHYQFNLPNGGLLSESDQVLVRFQVQPAVVSVVGGGVEGFLFNYLGVRADVRAILGGNRIRTRLDTAPMPIPGAPPNAAVRAVDPSIQIANNGLPTSLSLPGVNHFNSFEGAGRLMLVSVGAFFRF